MFTRVHAATDQRESNQAAKSYQPFIPSVAERKSLQSDASLPSGKPRFTHLKYEIPIGQFTALGGRDKICPAGNTIRLHAPGVADAVKVQVLS